MTYTANSPEEYIAQIPEERKSVFKKLRKVILDNIPSGFGEYINYGMLGYAVPKSTYPSGYHCDPELPVPFAGIASQKHFIAIYHMGIYANPKLLDWFVKEYSKVAKHKLDMGKSCVRFKHMDDIPYDLIGKLMTKTTVKDWVEYYAKTDPRNS